MTANPTARIASIARYLPDNVVTNHDLSLRVDTTDEWIRTRTGIRERRIAPDSLLVADMGKEAATTALRRAGLEADDVDLLLVATATPDRWLPATACDLQARLGAVNAAAMDVMGACTGFIYALSLAEGYVAAGRGETVLVVSTEKMSSIVDWEDRSTCVLFGDGAGAAVVVPSNGSGRGVLSSHLGSDGRLAELLVRPAGGAAVPITAEVLDDKSHLIRMAGREVFKNAVRNMADSCNRVLDDAGLNVDDVDLLVPHQANSRIIDATARYAGLPMDRVFTNIERYGNMSSATVPIAIDEAVEQGRIVEGSVLLTVAFGAGLTWGAMAIRW
ncbi:MAG: ketoacyl-ACP synthase III [Gemmatimonadetes bacterium]|nr:ketoacyl-ACP synthase III [Gemmatimonadota bacterium]